MKPTVDLELCWGTLDHLDTDEHIRAAGGAGFRCVTVSPSRFVRFLSEHSDGAAALKAALTDAGVSVTIVDCLMGGLPGSPDPSAVPSQYTGMFTVTADDCFHILDELGGWITDNYTWRWIFYINLPVGVFAALMVQAVVEDPPYIRNAKVERMDFAGFALLALWLGTFQVILDKGQQEDWLASPWIRWFAAISAGCFVGFILRELRTAHPIVNLSVLKNRNFGAGVLMITTLGAVLYGTTAALPIFLQTLMGYPALESGLALSPRGIGAFVTTFIVGRLIGRVRNRVLITLGFSLLAFSSFWLGHLNLQIGLWNVIWPSVLNGVGISFIFTPLTTAAVSHLRQEQIGNATGIYNLMRNLGGSFGIAMVSTLLVRRAQVHQALMAAHLTPFDPAYVERLAAVTKALTPQSGAVLAQLQAQGLIYNTLQNQASLWAFIENFRLFGLFSICCLPLVFLFKKAKPRATVPMAH